MKKARDLTADLAICEAAKTGPWYVDDRGGYAYVETGDAVVVAEAHAVDARFIAEAREGWSEAIRRAIAAEYAVRQMSAIARFWGVQRIVDIAEEVLPDASR